MFDFVIIEILYEIKERKIMSIKTIK